MLQLPGLRRAFADYLHRRLGIQAGALGKMQRLGKSLKQPADADLIDHLGQLTTAHRSHQATHPRIAVDDRLGSLKENRFTAHHDGQQAILRAGLTA